MSLATDVQEMVEAAMQMGVGNLPPYRAALVTRNELFEQGMERSLANLTAAATRFDVNEAAITEEGEAAIKAFARLTYAIYRQAQEDFAPNGDQVFIEMIRGQTFTLKE